MNATDGLISIKKFLIARSLSFLKLNVLMGQDKETHSAESISMMEEVKGEKKCRDVIS